MTEPKQQELDRALEARKRVAVTPLPIGPEHLDEEFRAGYLSREAEIQALKIQLGKCIIQESETVQIASAHGWGYNPDNYTDEKAMKAYREWKEKR